MFTYLFIGEMVNHGCSHMKASVLRLCSVTVSLLLVIGCAGVGDENTNPLTVANLQGTYDLNTDAMPADLAGDGFNMISEMLEIDANTLTFAPIFGDYIRF